MQSPITILITSLFCLFGCAPLGTVSPTDFKLSPDGSAPQLQLSADHRHLQSTSREPFFWLADTAWEMLHRLN